MPPNRRLLVLDDVWSKANLENLSFNEVKGCRTLITTRQASTLETHHSHTYTLGLLSEANAQSLFCYWVFGQESIPEWAEETLVNEVISECNCLPLALKVIAGSLSSAARVPIAWRNARDKLRQAEPLGEYHKEALQKRLQASIDALDPKLQECFLDLGAYPEGSKCSADTLLDIWVYVRGMEWADAVLALAELSTRCLLDFHKKFSSSLCGNDGLTLEYGSARALVFSQHDVMRDLALCLGRKDHPPYQRTRLLMPQKAKKIPMDWQLVASLTAQIISINTGDMMEQDWPPTLTFPFAEALLLYFDGDTYHLPPFVQSMCNLKVISIRSSKQLCNIVGSLGGLSHLQSIDMENVALITPDTMPKLEKLRLRVPEASGRVLSMLESRNVTSLSVLSLNVSCVPENCCQLRSLRLLYLFDCDRLCKLPEELGNLTNLECLSLRRCHVLKELPASMCKLQRLEVLEMRHCKKVKDLPKELGQLSALKELSLAFNEELRKLPRTFGSLSNLETLDLACCYKLENLPETFGQLVALKKLDLRGCHDLRKKFGLPRSLENLVLNECSGLKELPQNFGLLCNLKQLALERCSKLKHLPESFVQLSCLRKLNLSACSQLVEILPKSVGALQRLCHLEDLSLDNCKRLRCLPGNIGQLSCLRRLSLKGCSKLHVLPQSVGELSCLEYLSLRKCTSVTHLPGSLGQLRNLKQLDLTGASKLDALPESVGQLRHLAVLGLGDCKKLKHLPNSFGHLSALKTLAMDGVGLESLPASMGMGGLVALEQVECSESLVPLWKALRGEIAPHPQIKDGNATNIPRRRGP